MCACVAPVAVCGVFALFVMFGVCVVVGGFVVCCVLFCVVLRVVCIVLWCFVAVRGVCVFVLVWRACDVCCVGGAGLVVFVWLFGCCCCVCECVCACMSCCVVLWLGEFLFGLVWL